MSNTYTSNTKLAMPAIGDTGWSIPVNGNCTTLDALAPVGGLAVTTHEVPSASLNVDVAPGSYLKQDGTVGIYAGTGGSPQAITASTTKVLYLDLTAAGALTVAAAYPSTAHVRIATVTAGGSTIAAIVDNRQSFTVAGSVLDGTQVAVGTSTGLMIATASTQKLGFFGTTPIARPTMGTATAGASYTATEQAMLQAVYNAVRNLGLGS